MFQEFSDFKPDIIVIPSIGLRIFRMLEMILTRIKEEVQVKTIVYRNSVDLIKLSE